MKKKVMLGMSGGVDSSVAAILLLEKGYDVTGVTMKLRPDKYMASNLSGGCCSLDDIDDARRVCYKLGIEHLVLNFTDIFSEKVIDYFSNEYIAGRTPNPCIACNMHLKFDAMLRRAVMLGFDFIATGHYSIIEFDNNINRWILKIAPCSKDQSYVLYGMTQYQLSHTLFPLSGMEKSDVRAIAAKHSLPSASKPDSQEICFIEDKNYSGFIEKYTGINIPKGNFINKSGKILGKHNGITKYTIGQRKGLGISFDKHMYVINIDPSNNTITLGEEGQQYSSSLIASNLNFIPFDFPGGEINITAKVRYQSKPAAAKLIPLSKDTVKLDFNDPQRSITPGQAVVFYDGDLVVGGGTIMSTIVNNCD